MKKKIMTLLLTTVLSLSILCGCAGSDVQPEAQSATDDVVVRVAAMKGPTTMGLVKMWQDAGLIRVSVSSGLAKKLKQILGPNVKITIDEYGNEMNAQILRTAHQKKQKIVYDRLAEMPRLDHAGYKKIVPDSK